MFIEINKSMMLMCIKLIKDVGVRYGVDVSDMVREYSVDGLKKSSRNVKCVLPFQGILECDKNKCMGLSENHGLFSRCSQEKEEDDVYCSVCLLEAELNSSGKPNAGTVEDRLKVGILDYISPDGKKVVEFGKVMKKLKISRAAVEEEGKRLGIKIDEMHFNQKEKGRPKKEKRKIELVEDGSRDIFAELLSRVNDEESESDSDESVVAEVLSELVAVVTEVPVAVVVVKQKAKDAEKVKKEQDAKEAKAAEKLKKDQDAKDAKATKDAEKLKKDQDAKDAKATQDVEAKATQDVEAKATKDAEKLKKDQDAKDAKATKDAEKLKKDQDAKDAKATKDAEKLKKDQDAKEAKAAEKLKKEQDAKDAKEAKEAEKLKKEQDAKEAKEAEKLKKEQDAKEAKEAEKLKKETDAKFYAKKPAAAKKEKSKPAEVVPNKAEEVEEEEIDRVKTIEFEGKKYLKSKKTGIVYNLDQDVIGKWNEATSKIEFAEIEEEEEEDEYDV
jgi:hypothetical protein